MRSLARFTHFRDPRSAANERLHTSSNETVGPYDRTVATSIAFFNNKGGVGKTTLACNFAAYLSGHGYSVTVIVGRDTMLACTLVIAITHSFAADDSPEHLVDNVFPISSLLDAFIEAITPRANCATSPAATSSPGNRTV
jgi:CobQ/CobB/MinD/ParA nucleotide binding domain